MNKKATQTALKEKTTIFYARDYRHFSAYPSRILLFCALLVVPVVLVFLLFYSPLTHAMALWSGKVISQVTGETAELLSCPFIPGLGGVYYIGIPGHAPSFTHALLAGITSIAGLIIISQVKPDSRPLMLYISIALCVQLCSCLFFIIWPDRFPYDLRDYSQLYMIQTVALLIILPAILGLSLALLRISAVVRALSLLAQVFIQLLYGLTRYVVYMAILYYCSYLYMAALFFSLGVLFDFIQMVTIYGFVARKASEFYNSAEGKRRWAWL